MEGGVLLVARGPVGDVDPEAPRQVGRRAEQPWLNQLPKRPIAWRDRDAGAMASPNGRGHAGTAYADPRAHAAEHDRAPDAQPPSQMRNAASRPLPFSPK